MTDIFGNYRSQETRALADIKSSKYPDTNKDFEKNIQRLNEFVDYIASYLQTMQKGVDQANEDPITKLKGVVLDIGTLLGGGEILYGVNLGDLQYFLPAIGAMFGFDSSQPFPINLFQAVEHFFLGYILPLDSWAPAVNDVIDGWMNALGLDDAFKSAVQDLFLGFGRFVQDLMDILNNIVTLGGVFDMFDTTQSGPINELQIEWNMLLSQLTIANLGKIADPFIETLTPWIRAWSNMVNVIDDWLEIFSVGWGGDGMARINHWITDLLHWLGDPVGMGTGNLSTAGGVGSIPLFGPILNWLVGFDTGIPVLNQLIESLGGTGSTLADLGDTFASVQVDWNSMMAAFSSGNYTGGQANFDEMLANFMKMFGGPDLLTAYDPVAAATKALQNIFTPAGAVTSWSTLPNHHLAILSPGVLTNLLLDPTFDNASSFSPDGIYTWDGTVDHTGKPGSGSARTFANGTIRELESVSIQVTNDHTVDISTYAKWSGVIASSGSAISLCVNAYDTDGNLISDPSRRVATILTPGTSSIGYAGDLSHGASAADGAGWAKLTGSYVCPANTAYATLSLEVNSTVSVGTVWFDDCYIMMSIIDIGHVTSSTAAYDTFVQEQQQFWDWLTGSTTHPATVSGTTAQPAAIPNIAAGPGPGQSADLQDHIDNLVSQFKQNGDTVTNQTVGDALTALQLMANTVAGLSTKVQNQITGAIGASQSGKSYQVPFSTYPTGSFSSAPFNVTYGPIPGSGLGTYGTGHLILSGGNAKWSAVNDGDVSVIAIYNGGVTETDFQEVQATITGLPNGAGSRNYAVLRANAATAPSDYVYGVVFLNTSLQLCWELGCYVGGTHTVLDSGTNAPLNFNFTFVAGVGGDPYRFQGISGDRVVFDFTDSSHISQIGSGHRYWGFRSDTYNNGQVSPAPASYVGCADNAPPLLVGSGFRQYCSSATAVTVSHTATTNLVFPSGFFDTTAEATPDYSFSSLPSAYSGVPGVTVSNSGWYDIDFRCDIQWTASLAMVTISMGVLRVNAAGTIEESILLPGLGAAFNIAGAQDYTSHFSGSGGIACEAGDSIIPIYYIDGVGTSATLQFQGEASGAHTYWGMRLANLSLN